MSEEKKLESAADVERAASQAAREPKPKQKPVYIYLVAMFAVALLLMSLSFFMSHRSNQEVMGELQQNVNSFQLLQEAEERNAELLEKVPEARRDGLRAVLAQDPRPAYQNAPDRVYGMSFGGVEVKFSVREDVLTVREITPAEKR